MPDYLFVTGKLAAPALRAVLSGMAPAFSYQVAVLNTSVAALVDTPWIDRHLPDAAGCATVMLPGLCRGETDMLQERLGVPVVRGPADLQDLPAYFGGARGLSGYGAYQTRILAEITDAYALSCEAVLARACYYRECGADVIDLGGPASGGIPQVETMVAALKAEGFAVSIDSFDADTVLRADRAGVDMVLSVNSANLEIARELRAQVVVIPDFGQGLASLEKNAERLRAWGVPCIVDPILDPIAFGISESLWRFREVRRRYPEQKMLMGIGNVTELTEADSTGIIALLAGVMAELRIDFALTTEVAAWTRGAVRELDIARRLMDFAVRGGVSPKGIDGSLLTVKNKGRGGYAQRQLREMQRSVRDKNYRIFAHNGRITVFNRDVFIQGTAPAEIFAQLDAGSTGHAFYLGRELERASLALALGKKYVQEAPLDFGYISRDAPQERLWAASPAPD